MTSSIQQEPFITVVSGLPRSGTSMMMAMLEAGGIPALSDGVRTADDDNPRGYYEFEPVKQLALDDAWLDGAVGKSIKVISALIERLPPRHRYRVVFMERDMGEVLASQRAMLVRRGRAGDQPDDDRMGALFEKHLAKVRQDIAGRDELEVVYVGHADVIADAARAAAAVNAFLGGHLDASAMAGAVEARLYRQRSSGRAG